MGNVGDTLDSGAGALLAALKLEYVSRLPARAEAVAALVERGAWDEARRAAHKLRGSAATHGLVALGGLAAAIDDAILALGAPDRDGPEISPAASRVLGLARDLVRRAAAEAAAAESP